MCLEVIIQPVGFFFFFLPSRHQGWTAGPGVAAGILVFYPLNHLVDCCRSLIHPLICCKCTIVPWLETEEKFSKSYAKIKMH